jgi:hypothetical protein
VRTPILLVAVILASATGALAGETRHFGRGLVREGDALVVDDPAGKIALDLQGWEPLPDPPDRLVVLRRQVATGSELRILDRRGRPLGTIEVPQAWTGFATDAGVILVPEALHEPRRPHWIKFLGHGGELRAEVRKPELTLVSWTVAPGGGLATVSESTGGGSAWVILGYDGQGSQVWRHEVTGDTPPEALLVAGGQLVVLERDIDAGTATVTILTHGRGPKSHHLSNVTRMTADPDSGRIAVVGQEMVALLDVRTRRLVWRRDEPIDFVLHGGLRFDRRGTRLLVVNADRDRRRGKARLGLRRYRLSDGADDRASLGDAPVDELPSVVDVETPAEGEPRVLLHDRAVNAVPGDSTP